jgi:glycerol transport system permease protein
MKKHRIFGLSLYFVFLLLPIYWLLVMSFKSNQEILGQLTLWPQSFSFDNYITIFSDPSWYMGYVNSMIYVAINVIITLLTALPAAYAL